MRHTNQPYFRSAHVSDAKFLSYMDSIESDSECDEAYHVSRTAYWHEQLSDPEPDSKTYIAQMGALYIGYAVVALAETTTAADVFVSPNHRGKGVARGLLLHAGVSCESLDTDATVLLLNNDAAVYQPAAEIEIAV